MSLFANLLDAWRTVRADRLFPPAREDLLEPGCLALRALEVAETQIGLAEDGHNGGEHVARWVAPAKPPQNYCAGGIGWSYQEAARQLGWHLPFKRSLGAKRLGRNVAEAGRLVTDWRELSAGDLGVSHRGAEGSWTGHVWLVVGQFDRGVHTIEWNRGPVVDRFARYPDNPKERWAFGASLRR